MKSPTGRITGTNRPTTTASGATITGNCPMIVAKILTDSGKARRDMAFTMRKQGLESRLVHELGTGCEVHEVWGTTEGLGVFMEKWFVLEATLPIACRVGFIASGDGKLTPSHVRQSIYDQSGRCPKVGHVGYDKDRN